MSRRPILVWSTLALVGVLIAVGVSYAASRLASPHVGLSSEPITAGAKLAPASADAGAKPKSRAGRKQGRKKQPGKGSSTAPPPTHPAAPPSGSGSSGGSGSTPGGSGSTPGGSGSTPGGSGSSGHGSDDSGSNDSGGSGGHGSDDGDGRDD